MRYKRFVLLLMVSMLIIGCLMQQKVFEHVENPKDKNKQLSTYKVILNQSITDKMISQLRQISTFEGQLDDKTVLIRTSLDLSGKIKEIPAIKNIEKFKPSIANIQGNANKNTDSVVKSVYIVTLFSDADKNAVIKKINALDSRVIDGAGTTGNSLLVEVPLSRISNLSQDDRILYIEKYENPSLLNDRVRDIIGSGALGVKGFINDNGLTGQGEIIALADSGLDKGNINDLHPDFQNEEFGKSKIMLLKSMSGMKVPADTIGHGTHMAGTMVGSGAASGGKYAGIAPGARLIVQDIVNIEDKVTPPVNIEELFKPAYALGARVHVNGWGREENTYGSISAQIDKFIWYNPDFLAIFSAGNKGPAGKTITSEANSKNALVVGASASPRPAFDSTNIDSLKPADFSSRGPTMDGRLKPDLLAPGTSIISTASRMLNGNLLYTMMQGSSMAAAVAGGSSALLREYLHDCGNDSPTSALIKALLINGARVSGAGPGNNGFGVIDLASSIISLKENTMKYDDNLKGLISGDTAIYEYNVKQSGEPLKVTLAWVDPPSLPGATTTLVNDLDLLVTAPDGKQYYGNSFVNGNQPDRKNNVEQVYLPNPREGKYIIRVIPNKIAVGTGESKKSQDFALVYGQVIQGQTMENVNKTKITSSSSHYVLNGATQNIENSNIHPGTRVYEGDKTTYLIGKYWHALGAEVKKTLDGLLFTEIDPKLREGGYYSDTTDCFVNGEIKDINNINLLPGTEVRAFVDPFTQKISEVNIFYKEVQGVVNYIDDRNIKLLNNPKEYSLSKNISLFYKDNIKDADPIDIAFGSHGEIPKILPGMPVRMVISPTSSEVSEIIIDREVVCGRISSTTTNELLLENGKMYNLMPDINIRKNKIKASIQELAPGDYVTALLLPETNKIIGITANTKVIYGKVILCNNKDKTIYLKALSGALKVYQLAQDIDVYRWGQKTDVHSIASDKWVRMFIDQRSGQVYQLDIAESLPEETKILANYDKNNNLIETTDGNSYYLGGLTSVYKNGFPLPAWELTWGDNINVEVLVGDSNHNKIAVSIEAEGTSYGTKPSLKVSTVSLVNSCWVTGNTDAKKLYLYDATGFNSIQIKDNKFTYIYDPGKGGKVAFLVAIGPTGEISGIKMDYNEKEPKSFKDLEGHWAAKDILKMSGEGLVSGYADGYFKPDHSITRAEFTVIISRAFGWDSSATSKPSTDVKKLAPWASEPISAAVERGVVIGYPDGNFRPMALLSRQEECVILSRLIDMYNLEMPSTPGENSLPFKDMDSISSWAKSSVEQLYHLGIINGRTVNYFMPLAPATRAETAILVYRLLNTIREKEQGVIQ